MPRAASEDWGSANCRCVTPGDPPAPGRRPTHQPSHHTRTARWPAGTLRPAAPASPCPFRIMAPQDPYDRAAPATRSPSAPPPTLARAHAGLTRLSRPIECATPGPAPGRAPPLRQHARPMVCVAGLALAGFAPGGCPVEIPPGPGVQRNRLVPQVRGLGPPPRLKHS